MRIKQFVFTADLSPGWVAATCQRGAVKLCPQSSAPSPLVWEIWTWVTTTCRMQEWRSYLLDWRVHTVTWRLSGQYSADMLTVISIDSFPVLSNWLIIHFDFHSVCSLFFFFKTINHKTMITIWLYFKTEGVTYLHLYLSDWLTNPNMHRQTDGSIWQKN